jgi:hypothetical protein
MRRYLRFLPLALLILPVVMADGIPPGWLRRPTPVCSDGAVTTACKCNGAKVTTGYCCSGVAQAYQCPLIPEDAGKITHVYFTGTAIADTLSACNWTQIGTVPQVAAVPAYGLPPGAGPFSGTNAYKCDPNGNGNDPTDFAADFTCTASVSVDASETIYDYIFANYTNNAAGYYLQFAANGRMVASFHWATNNQATADQSIAPGGRPMVISWGRVGNTGWMQHDRNWTSTIAITTVTPATSAIAYLGRGLSANGWKGLIYEFYCTSATPTDALFRAQQEPVLLPRKATNIIALGDSITVASTAGTSGWANTLTLALPYPWIVSGHAFSGKTSANILSEWTNAIRGGPFGTVAVWIGVNDISTSITAATAWGNIQTVADQVRADAQRLILFTVTPFKGYTGWTTDKEAQRKLLNTSIRDYATAHAEVLLIDTDALFNDGSDALIVDADYGDHLHLNATAQAQVGTAVYNDGHTKGWW